MCSRFSQDVQKCWRSPGWSSGMWLVWLSRVWPHRHNLKMRYHITSYWNMSSILPANESANHNWYDLLHEVWSEDYWESSWAVHADRWKQSGYRFLQVSVHWTFDLSGCRWGFYLAGFGIFSHASCKLNSIHLTATFILFTESWNPEKNRQYWFSYRHKKNNPATLEIQKLSQL